MEQKAPSIERLTSPISDADCHDLAVLLLDAVESGAAVSFLADLTPIAAESWWRQNLASLPCKGTLLVARDPVGIAGCVQLQPAWAPNQPHRAEVVKLLVHRRARGIGLGLRLMQAIETAAERAGFRLLTLDAKEGGAAESLYRKLGWTELGTIADYALDPDGTPHAAVFFFKRLGRRNLRDEG